MKNPNAIVLFARTPDVARSGAGDPLAALPWEEIDSIFHGCAGDLVQSAMAVPDADVLVYREQRFPASRIAAQTGDAVAQYDLAEGPIGEAVQQAVDGAFLEFYHRVAVVLDNNPLVGTGVLTSALDQLGVEDDCAAIVPNGDGGIVAVALKAGCPGLFSGRTRGAPAETPAGGPWSGVLPRLCREELMLFPLRPSFPLQSTSDLDRLRAEISALDPASAAFPKRTGAAFRALEKKYRWKKARA